MTVSVYLGSRPGNNPVHCQNAYKLGRLLAEAGISVVYGGARVGTMGELARGVIEAGGSIKGVIPTGFKGRKSYADKGMDVWLPGIEKIETPDFPTRITTMENMCDAFIVLPGSCGTLHEFSSALEGSVLGRYEKKIAILNTGGYGAHPQYGAGRLYRCKRFRVARCSGHPGRIGFKAVITLLRALSTRQGYRLFR